MRLGKEQDDNPVQNGPVAVDKPSMQTSSWNPLFAYQLEESALAVEAAVDNGAVKTENSQGQNVSNDANKVKAIPSNTSFFAGKGLEPVKVGKNSTFNLPQKWFTRFNFLILIAVVLVIILIIIIAVLVPRLQDNNGSISGLPKGFSKGNFTIQLRFMTATNLDETHKQLIIKATERWETIILKELPSTSELPADTEGCPGFEDTSFATTQTIENLLVFVYIKNIDGPDGVLAVSGPCRFDQDLFPRTGVMTLDAQDVVKQASVNNLGTTWDILRLITPSTTVGTIQYLGPQGKIGNAEIGRDGNPIVESKGGPGTARGHWAEDIYKDELMTGFFFSNHAPLSRLTVRALIDQGYEADPNRADAFIAPRRRLMLRHTQLDDDMEKPTSYGQDALQGPFHRIQSMPKPGLSALQDSNKKAVWDSLLL